MAITTRRRISLILASLGLMCLAAALVYEAGFRDGRRVALCDAGRASGEACESPTLTERLMRPR